MYAYPSVLTWRSREWQREIGIDAEEEKERNERERERGATEKEAERGEKFGSRGQPSIGPVSPLERRRERGR